MRSVRSMRQPSVVPAVLQRPAASIIPLLLSVLALSLGGCITENGWKVPGDGPSHADRLLFEEGGNRPPSAATLYSMARIVRAQGKESIYQFMLERIINEHPRFIPAYCDLAEVYASQSDFDAAIETLAAGLRVSPNDPILINDIGMCWLFKKDYVRSLEYFRQAAALAPEDASYRANMAVALGMLGRYEESLSLYEQVIPVWDAHYNLAVLCAARKDDVRAAEERRKARQLAP